MSKEMRSAIVQEIERLSNYLSTRLSLVEKDRVVRSIDVLVSRLTA